MRILILSSSTGGGHDMRARALESWCRKLSTDSEPLETFRFQALEESAGIYKFGVELYNWIQKKCPWLHHLYFNWLEIFQISASERLLLGKAKYIAQLEAIRPDVIVSVHAHTNHAFRAIAKKRRPGVQFATYCGEMHSGYGFSRHWVDPGADVFIGATQAICDAALKLGMPQERTIYGGFLLDPSFYGETTSAAGLETLRQDLGLLPNTFTLLLSTGANGAENHLHFLAALSAAKLDLQVIALCGRNDTALESIAQWGESSPRIKVCPLSYREDIFSLMQLSDVVVARPGTGTTSEAIMADCPILFNGLGGIMPQEWITVKYLRSQGFSAACIKKPSDLVHQLRPLLRSQAELKDQKSGLQKLCPKPQPCDIIRLLQNLSVSRS